MVRDYITYPRLINSTNSKFFDFKLQPQHRKTDLKSMINRLGMQCFHLRKVIIKESVCKTERKFSS